jgi:hypothetical protein
MNHVQVVAINTTPPDDVLAKAVAELNEKHIAPAVESLVQSWVDQPKYQSGLGEDYLVKEYVAKHRQ